MTIGKADECRLKAFKVKGSRRILRIPWTELIFEELKYRPDFLQIIKIIEVPGSHFEKGRRM